MADPSPNARDELHESELSQSSMFCFDNASPENSCFVADLLCFFHYAYEFCVSECDEKGKKSSTIHL